MLCLAASFHRIRHQRSKSFWTRIFLVIVEKRRAHFSLLHVKTQQYFQTVFFSDITPDSVSITLEIQPQKGAFKRSPLCTPLYIQPLKKIYKYMQQALVLAILSVKWIHLFLQTLFIKTSMLFNIMVPMKSCDYWLWLLGGRCMFWAADPLPLGLRVNTKFSGFTPGNHIPCI